MFAHLDADAFFASVLQRKYPHLRGKPLLAGGMGGGIAIAASYEAKAKGVKTGMSIAEAKKLCPDVIVMPADFRETGFASQQIEGILQSACPIIEQMSVDEWFLDLASIVGGTPKDLDAWANGLRVKILTLTGLSMSVGVAPTKILAKMASEYRKPGGVTVLRNLQTFLSDRPAAAIPGIGRKRTTVTDGRGWVTAWDFANADRSLVLRLFGKSGPELQRELLGEAIYTMQDDTAPPKSMSRCRTFRRTTKKHFLWAHLLHHLQYLILRLRREQLTCAGISVWLRDSEYRHVGTSAKPEKPADREEELAPLLERCFAEIYKANVLYNQAAISLWFLTPRGAGQFSLFEEPDAMLRGEKFQAALDRVRQRFGREAITRGAALSAQEGSKPGLGLPTLE